MSFPSRLSVRLWLLIPFCACGFLVWSNFERIQHVQHLMHTDSEEARIDGSSPTGYAGGKRWLIVPERNNRSYQWIAETQQMLARGEWRVRRVDYENAPTGREVHTASPYRWWLGLIAWGDHLISGQPLGFTVERAALWADPLLQLLLLIGTTVYVARQFGILPAALLSLGLALLFPFAGGFVPGVPDDKSLTWICALWSVLPLLAGTYAYGAVPTPVKSGKTRNESAAPDTAQVDLRLRRPFLLAGVAGGLGLWISTANQLPILIGLAVSGILAAGLGAKAAVKHSVEIPSITPWRIWALGGAITSLAAYLTEYFPAHLEFRLQVNHPLFGLVWLGTGEVMVLIDLWRKQGKPFWSFPHATRLVLAIAALAALPLVLALVENQAVLTADPSASRLSWLPDAAVAKNFAAWVTRDGLTVALAATCLPLLILIPALWMLFQRQTRRGPRTALALALGPTLVTLILAWSELRWWSMCDSMVLLLVVVATATISARSRWLWAGGVSLLLLPGLSQLWPPTKTGETLELTRHEAEGLIERSIAHWIADRAGSGGAVVLLPPDRTTGWCFHGGMRGLGTANWENRDGLAATVRIVTATTADDAQALIAQRGVTHLILPSWDTDLDEFARWTLANPNDAFVMALHHWALPPWLRPLPYNLPVVAGFEDQSVVILEVTDESNRAAAIGRLAEYFIETKQTELAAATVPTLQRYPTDLGVLVALAQVEQVRGNTAGYTKAFAALLTSLTNGFDRTLAWDRRVSLAVVLAQGDHHDLAREQVRKCLERLDEKKLRSLTTGGLYRLQVLGKAFDQRISDPKLRELALSLLPAELRGRI